MFIIISNKLSINLNKVIAKKINIKNVTNNIIIQFDKYFVFFFNKVSNYNLFLIFI